MKQTTIILLLSISLLLSACGPSAREIKETAQAEILQAQTQTALVTQFDSLAMTQTAMADLPGAIVPTEAPLAEHEKVSCPVYVFQDWDADSRFVPEGHMGDTADIKLDDNFRRDPDRPNVIRISYTPQGEQGWAGIYWWVPGTAWGDEEDVGLDISCASKLTFWARGENGGEKAEFKTGGIKGTYSDSLEPAVSSGPITLTDKWVEYSIDLTGKDLSHIMGGFVWATNKKQNAQGAVIYIDDICFEE